jgi:hypothetical protein
MIKSLFTFFVCVSFLIFNCTPSTAQKKDKRSGFYSAYLYEAEGVKNHKIDSENSVYEDSLIKIDWAYGNSQIEFDLTNKSSQTIKIIWDDAAYVSISNESGRIFHKGIKYTDRENSMPPTSVYKNTTLSDLIAPTSYSKYVSG